MKVIKKQDRKISTQIISKTINRNGVVLKAQVVQIINGRSTTHHCKVVRGVAINHLNETITEI